MNPIKFYRKDYHKYFTDFPRRCAVMLDWHKYEFFPPYLALTVFYDYYIQVVPWILVYPILVDAIKHIFCA